MSGKREVMLHNFSIINIENIIHRTIRESLVCKKTITDKMSVA